MTVLLKLRILNDLHCFDNSFKKRKEYFSGNRIFVCELRRVSLVASREEKKRLYILRGDVSYGKSIYTQVAGFFVAVHTVIDARYAVSTDTYHETCQVTMKTS